MNKLKIMYFGLGFLAGLGAVSFFTRRPVFIRDAASTVLSYGIAAKKRIESAAMMAKESLEDLTAESAAKCDKRKVSEKANEVVSAAPPQNS
jgi:hypothetical protein